LCKVFVLRSRLFDDKAKSDKISKAKESIYRNLLFFPLCDVPEHVF